jgi:hypothetical protein
MNKSIWRLIKDSFWPFWRPMREIFISVIFTEEGLYREVATRRCSGGNTERTE